MQLTIDLVELQKAPAEVRDWFLGQMGTLGGYAGVAADETKEDKKPGRLKPRVKKDPTQTSIVDDSELTTLQKAEAILSQNVDDVVIEEVSMEDLLAHAVKFIQNGRNAELKSILTDFKIDRVRDCPADKVAELASALGW